MSGKTPASFVGRTRELTALAGVVTAAAEGRHRGMVVRGGPGMGKSALLRELCRSPTSGQPGPDGARPVPVRRLLAQCRPSHRARPYAVLRSVLTDAMRTEPQDPAVDPVVDPARAVAALRAGQPLLLLLDDGHWADDETLSVLTDLLTDGSGRGLGLVLACRRQPVPPPLDALETRLVEAGLAERLELGPLDEVEAHALAATVLDRPPDPAAQAQVDLAAGNPLQILDLLQSMQARGRTAPAAGASRGVASEPADGCGHGVLAPVDLTAVGPGVRDLVGMAALLGPRFSVRDLCVAMDRSMTQLLPEVREALVTGILTDAGEDCLAFTRVDLHRALYEELPPAVRGELHRDIAERLQQAGAPAGAVALHLLSCPSRSSDSERLVALADQVLPASPEMAVALWRRHRAVAGPDDASRSRADAGLAAAYLAAGELDLAETTARRALVCRSPTTSLAALSLVLTTSILWQRRWHAARATAESAASSALLQPWDRAEQTALAATASLFAGDTEAALEATDRAAASATAPGSGRVRVRIDLVRGRLAHVRGDLQAARRLLDGAARSTLTDGSRETVDAGALPLHAALLAELDRMPDAAALLDRGEELARARGAWAATTATLATRAGVLLDRGDLAGAAQALDACLAREDAGLAGTDPVLAARRAAVALHVDGPDGAEKWLARLADRPDSVAGLPGVGWLFRARAADMFARGMYDEWTAELQRGWSMLARSGPRTEMLLLGPELAEALARVSDRRGVVAVTLALEGLADRAPGVTTMRAAALTARGIADASPAVLAESMRAWQASPRRLQAARVTELVAGRLSRLRRRTQADEMSAEAVRGYVECGAAYDAGRLREQRRSRPRPAVVPEQGQHGQHGDGDGWAALTPTERVVAGFVELGESNSRIAERLVISRRTVETHVSHILAKLRLRSRAELRVAAAQAGRLPEAPAVPEGTT